MKKLSLPEVLAVIITVVWVMSLTLDATTKSYDPPATVHMLMMAAAGWAFGDRFVRRGSQDGNNAG